MTPRLPKRARRRVLRLAIMLAGIGFLEPSQAAPATIKLATWNLEWFMTPAGFHALEGSCTRDDRAHRRNPRSLPCDVAAGLERSATDIAGLAGYAWQLDAEVVALEEVDGPEAARQLFPGYGFCFTGGRAVQNIGFAVRRTVPFRCGADLDSLSLGDTLRRGASVVLYPGTARELHLLAVHLKSGCARAPLDSHQQACQRLARQGPALHAWLADQARAGHRYAVLGDFNRDLLAETRAARAQGSGAATLWAYLGATTGTAAATGAALVNTAAGAGFRNCYAGQTHTGFIDYILLGDRLAGRLVAGSFERLSYSMTDAWRLRLSDHCPVAIRLRLD